MAIGPPGGSKILGGGLRSLVASGDDYDHLYEG